MDYLKFLGATILAIIAIGIHVKSFGIDISLFVTLGLTIGGFAMRAPARYIAGYAGWLGSSFAWLFATRALLRFAVAQQPNAYTPATIAIEGLLLLAGMILLHPACYALAR